ncbi:MAG: helix-turn-helix domain-containing protein [Acidobacteriota bacterium]
MATSSPRKRRSPCPVACTLDVIGDKWTLLVVRDLFSGKTQFKELAKSPERIATNILTDRLERLLAYELIERVPSPEHRGRHAYRLTEKGRSLHVPLEAIAEWGLEHLEGTEKRVAVSV